MGPYESCVFPGRSTTSIQSNSLSSLEPVPAAPPLRAETSVDSVPSHLPASAPLCCACLIIFAYSVLYVFSHIGWTEMPPSPPRLLGHGLSLVASGDVSATRLRQRSAERKSRQRKSQAIIRLHRCLMEIYPDFGKKTQSEVMDEMVNCCRYV